MAGGKAKRCDHCGGQVGGSSKSPTESPQEGSSAPGCTPQGDGSPRLRGSSYATAEESIAARQTAGRSDPDTHRVGRGGRAGHREPRRCDLTQPPEGTGCAADCSVDAPQTRCDEREPGAVGSVQQALCGTPRTGGPQKQKVGLAGVERVITEWAQVFFWDEEHNGIGNTLNATRMGHCVLCEFHLS